MTIAEREQIVVLDPTVGEEVRSLAPAPRLESLRGRRVGLMSNAKPMADVYLRALGETLQERYGVEWELEVKPDPSRIAPRALLDSLSARTHAIITGVGD